MNRGDDPGAETVVPLLEARGLYKRYQGAVALIDMNFSVTSGSVAGLIGKNGAGKSTLIRILSGAEHADRGAIFLEGTRRHFTNPLHARRAGIVTVYQELSLVPMLSVAENICMGAMPHTRTGAVRWGAVYEQAREQLRVLGCTFSPRRSVHSLKVGEQQIVELARALRSEARVLILDEPTAALSKSEVDRLAEVIDLLRRAGLGIIYVSHRLEEVERLCDEITVVRDGRNYGTYSRGTIRQREMTGLIVGAQPNIEHRTLAQPIAPAVHRESRRIGSFDGEQPRDRLALEVRGLSDADVLQSIDFDLHQGEVLAVTGLAGSGQAELAEALFGARHIRHGTVTVFGRPARIRSPRAALRLGLGLVPEDRKVQGLVLHQSIRLNMTLASLRTVSSAGLIRPRREYRLVADQHTALGIKSASLKAPVSSLSGGNQQKVVLGKWLARESKLLVLAEPTRGVDVGARRDLYDVIGRYVAAGSSCLIVTSDLNEALLADRVLILKDGRVSTEVSHQELDQLRTSPHGEAALLELCG